MMHTVVIDRQNLLTKAVKRAESVGCDEFIVDEINELAIYGTVESLLEMGTWTLGQFIDWYKGEE